MILKQGTVYTRLFMMVQSANHISGITGASPVVYISKNGATGVLATNSPAIAVDNTNLPGLYSIVLAAADVSALGDLGFAATASSADPTNWVDQVQSQIFPDIALQSGSGTMRALIANNLTQDTALNSFLFPMTSAVTGALLPGLTVTVQRTLGSGGFSNCANTPATEVGGAGATGIYYINLANSDVNAGTVGLLCTATGANTLFIPVIPTP